MEDDFDLFSCHVCQKVVRPLKLLQTLILKIHTGGIATLVYALNVAAIGPLS